MVVELLDKISTVSLISLSVIATSLCILYAFDIVWNLARSVLDYDRGLTYYFSKKGPDN